MRTTPAVDRRRETLDDLARRYVWWSDDAGTGDDVTVAQVMSLGTYDDILRLEAVMAPQDLRAVMLRARAGWIDARSWAFWRGRLLAQGCADIPEAPPKRAFHAELL
ncbi:hypothetical protein [Rhodoplanes azumiensis]|uniref:Uncharacterized protein n=1 Tax=Rhodoplanes azumiensis TaxID=1897628 RepID=A0ABW5AL95_9BRAD